MKKQNSAPQFISAAKTTNATAQLKILWSAENCHPTREPCFYSIHYEPINFLV